MAPLNEPVHPTALSLDPPRLVLLPPAASQSPLVPVLVPVLRKASRFSSRTRHRRPALSPWSLSPRSQVVDGALPHLKVLSHLCSFFSIARFSPLRDYLLFS